jgi:hypothetical protein
MTDDIEDPDRQGVELPFDALSPEALRSFHRLSSAAITCETAQALVRPCLHSPFCFRLNQPKESHPVKGGVPTCLNLEPDRAG